MISIPQRLNISLLCLCFFYTAITNAQNYADSAQAYQILFANNNTFSNFAGGVSLVDFNQDGLDDISLATGFGDSLAFYQNTGSGFTKISALVPHVNEAEAIIWVDFDNDGDKDLYVSAFDAQNEFYRNDGFPIFTRITNSLGTKIDSTSQTFGSCWGDYNRDGYLDLYEANRQTNQITNQLFTNNGGISFTNSTVFAGVADSNKLSFAPTFLDFNNDLWVDLFVAEDKHNGNILYKNLQNGTFSNVSSSANMDVFMEGMTATLGDYNNDGFIDVYVTNTPGGNKLFKNNGDETFTDVTSAMGVAVLGVCWAASFFDYDLDGDQDLYVSDMQTGDTVSKNTLFENHLGSFISHVSPFPGDTVMSLSHALADFNNDGHYDIVSPNQQPHILKYWESSNPNNNNYIKVSLEGVKSNRDGISTWIEIHSSGKPQYKFVHCGGTYLGQHSTKEIFGLGLDTIVDTLVLRWDSGHVDSLYNLNTNQHYHLIEGVSVQTKVSNLGSTWICENDTNGTTLSVDNPYHFKSLLWSTGDTTRSINVNQPGSYWVIGETDLGFIDTSLTLNILIDSIEMTSTTISDTSGLGAGSATVFIQGGIPPFQFMWNDASAQITSTAVNLSFGSYTVWISDSLGCIDSLIVAIDNYSGVGLESKILLNTIQLYPNPGDDYILLNSDIQQFGTSKIRCYNSLGQIVWSGTWNASQPLKIKTDKWKSGLYTLKLLDKLGAKSLQNFTFHIVH